MFVIKTQNIRFFYKEAKVKPRETLYINAKHAIVSDEGFVRLFDERGEQIFMGSLSDPIIYPEDFNGSWGCGCIDKAIAIALLPDRAVRFTDISAEEV